MISIRRVPLDSDLLPDILQLDRETLPEAKPALNTDWWGAYWGHFDDLVAYAGGRALPSGAYFLSRAGVLESHRGQRLQLKLIRARVRFARAQGFPRIVTYTVPHNAPHNAPSMNSLIHAGFRTYDPDVYWAGESVVYWRWVAR